MKTRELEQRVIKIYYMLKHSYHNTIAQQKNATVQSRTKGASLNTLLQKIFALHEFSLDILKVVQHF